MSVSNQLESEIDLLISAPEASFGLAVSCLSKHLGVSCQDAAAQLRSGRIMLPADDSGRPLFALLRTLGVTLTAMETGLFSVSIRLPQPSDFAKRTVARILGRDLSAIATALNSPWGLILTDLPKAEADRLQTAVRRYPGIAVMAVAHAEAKVDIFAPVPIPSRAARALSNYIAGRGLQPCQSSGALIRDVTFTDATQITRRFADCGLLALPHAFQRFDLFLTGIGTLSAVDVMAFLQMRGDQSGRMAESVTALAPLQVETDLSRDAAMAFCADYAAIGLDVSLRLMNGNS